MRPMRTENNTACGVLWGGIPRPRNAGEIVEVESPSQEHQDRRGMRDHVDVGPAHVDWSKTNISSDVKHRSAFDRHRIGMGAKQDMVHSTGAVV